MNDFNTVVITGRVVSLPKTSATQGGTQVAEFDVAINKTNRNGSEEASFVGVVAYGRLADICGQYLGKGAPILVSGSLRQEKWQDRQTGQNRSAIRIVANEVKFLWQNDAPQQAIQQPQQMVYARSDMYPNNSGAANSARPRGAQAGAQMQPPPPQQQTFDGMGQQEHITTDPDLPF